MRRWRSLAAAAALALTASGCVSSSTTRREPPPMPEPAPRPPVAAPVPAPTPAAPEPVEVVPAGPRVKVGIAVDTTRVEVGGASGLMLTDAADNLFGIGEGQRAVFTPSPGGVTMRVMNADGSAGREWRATLPVTVRPQGDSPLTLRGAAYRGAVLIQAGARGRLTAVNQIDMESYLLGVVPREIGTVGDTLVEAAKAQAVAARTYAVKYLGRRAARGFDVFATVDDQVYGGVAAEHAPVSRAVRATAGEILTYAGSPIEAYYHSTCAGRTAAIEEVWPQPAMPYLVSVVDTDPAGEAYDRRSSRFRWTHRWTHEALVGILNRTLADSLGGRRITEIRDMRVLARTPSDRIRAMRIETDAGMATVGRDRIRWILPTNAGAPLNSSKFDVRLERDAGGRVAAVVAEGGGWGHGIGMCQVGAMGRARAGQDYQTILRTYYPGTQLTKMY